MSASSNNRLNPESTFLRKEDKQMKKTIRIVSCFLAVVLLCSLGVQAFASEDTSPAITSAGIIDASELQKMMDDFVEEYGLNTRNRNISIGFCYLKTGDTWYYNVDKWYYSASLYKVPVAMLLAEREVAGEITADTMFENQYSSGTLETLERRSLVDSNNNTGHAMVEWMNGTYAGKCADQIIKFTNLPESYFNQDFYDVSYYNVEFYTQVLQTLYNSPDSYPRILDYMKQAQPGAYLRTNLEGTYEIAQKYGAFEEVKANPVKNNNHVGGIIYTPNPIIVTIMSVNMENFNKRIGDLGKMFADYALQLDSRLASYEAEQARAQQEEAERLAREEQERLAREEEQRRAAEAAIVSTPAPTVAPVAAPTEAPSAVIAAPAATDANRNNGIGATQRIILIVGLAVFIVGLALLLVILNSKRRRKAQKTARITPVDDDYYEDDEEEYLEPPEVKRNPRRTSVSREEESYQYASPVVSEEDDYDEEYEEYEEEDENLSEPSAGRAESWTDEPEEEPEEEYLTDGDYLENDTFLDQSDYKDFQTDYGYGDYSAYETEVYDDKPQEKTNRFTGTGNHYKPKH